MTKEKIKENLEYFLTNNKSGIKTREKWLKKNNTLLYNEIKTHSNSYGFNDLSFKEEIWCYINNVIEQPRCECNKVLKFKKSLSEGYGEYCSIKCTNKSEKHKSKARVTNIVKYGGSSPLHSNEIKDKIKETNLERYGVANIFSDVEYIKKATIKKHNVTHISKLESTKEKIRLTNLERYGITTPLLDNEVRQKGINRKLDVFYEKYNKLMIRDTNGVDISINCPKCLLDYTINRSVLHHRIRLTDNPCTHCYPIKAGTSIIESELKDFLVSLNLDIIENDRTLLNGKELDILIPDKNIAIELNGVYWHSEKYVTNDYHLTKTELCNSKGVQLIHIFEDEWCNKSEIVKSRIRDILGLTKHRIYARKCQIKEVKTKDKTKFINEHHIQGSTGSNVNLGLYYNDELVSIMTFGGLRKVLGLKGKENSFELVRFCNKLDTTVIGGASRLLKYFVRTYQPEEIISYADRRWSTGNLYHNLGFMFSHNSRPNYFYVVNSKREHRFKYRKNLLVKEGYNEDNTEHEIMLERGIYRIYDCGTITYKLKFP